jgi:hypothetical protein
MFRCPRRRGPIGTPPRVGTIGTFTRGLFRCSDAPRRVPYRCLKCALCGRKSPHGRNQKAKHRRQRPQPRLRLRRRSRNPVVLPERQNGCLRAALGRILIMGDREQSIEFDWLPFVNGRHVRPRFFCPACARGSQDIAEYPSRLNGRRPLGPSCWPVPGTHRD